MLCAVECNGNTRPAGPGFRPWPELVLRRYRYACCRANATGSLINASDNSGVLVRGQVTIIFVASAVLCVCLFLQSFSQPSLIRFRPTLDICYMSASSCVP